MDGMVKRSMWKNCFKLFLRILDIFKHNEIDKHSFSVLSDPFKKYELKIILYSFPEPHKRISLHKCIREIFSEYFSSVTQLQM